MITGTDLVHWQLRVAAGNALPMEQADIPMRGHAIEARIYAENPKKNFVPDTGKLLRLRPPHTHITPTRSVRVDTGVEEGGEVSVHYDPMIAKLIVHGPDRPEALRMMDKALGDYQVAGLSTNIEFLRNIVTHPDFLAGEVETGFIPKHSKELFPPEESKDFPVKTVGKAMLSLLLQQEQGYVGASPPQEDPYSPFSSVKSWRLGHPSSRTLTCLWEGMKAHVTLTRLDRPDSFYDLSVEVEGNPDMNCTYSRIFARLEKGPDAQGLTRIEMEGSEAEGMGVRSNVTLIGGGGDGGAGGAGNVLSPMPCKLTQVLVKAGQKVSAGDALVVVEAMKMEHVVKAPKDGVVERVVYEEIGCLIPEKKVLVTFHSSEEVVKEDA
ncbi:rudiment single hybrid motif-containing protein [Piptocephalis cylindrospora]|uniref:Rudiment single hybrid motif-containing protein n=1 Tax=Piptocephalis cylindrospora TaxID=1907219 RepID=A0A4P9Y5I2_9FUNG|nr:rudiment single hybrid motif-containing protein [Piptocephalis cylindrospora]|eukprot:RKP13451.1 rudiment single hybrid motif-containing protein [Piptocephalis cylindrospora]